MEFINSCVNPSPSDRSHSRRGFNRSVYECESVADNLSLGHVSHPQTFERAGGPRPRPPLMFDMTAETQDEVSLTVEF